MPQIFKVSDPDFDISFCKILNEQQNISYLIRYRLIYHNGEVKECCDIAELYVLSKDAAKSLKMEKISDHIFSVKKNLNKIKRRFERGLSSVAKFEFIEYEFKLPLFKSMKESDGRISINISNKDFIRLLEETQEYPTYVSKFFRV